MQEMVKSPLIWSDASMEVRSNARRSVRPPIHAPLSPGATKPAANVSPLVMFRFDAVASSSLAFPLKRQYPCRLALMADSPEYVGLRPITGICGMGDYSVLRKNRLRRASSPNDTRLSLNGAMVVDFGNPRCVVVPNLVSW